MAVAHGVPESTFVCVWGGRVGVSSRFLGAKEATDGAGRP
jgi:hypothetical protein